MITAITPNFNRNYYSNNKINNNQQNFNGKLPIIVGKHAQDGNIIGSSAQRRRDMAVDGFEHFFGKIAEAVGITSRVDSLENMGAKIKFQPKFPLSSKMTGTLVDKQGKALQSGDKFITCELHRGEEAQAAMEMATKILDAGARIGG